MTAKGLRLRLALYTSRVRQTSTNRLLVHTSTWFVSSAINSLLFFPPQRYIYIPTMATASTIASNGVIRSSTPSGLTSLRTHLQARHASNGSSPIPNSNTSNASRSSAPSPSVSPTRPKFDGPLLKAYIKKLLASTLGSSTWPDAKDKDRVRLWCREIGERVKERAVGMSLVPF